MFLDNQGYEKTKNNYFTTYVMNCFGIAQKIIKSNNQKRKQKTKPYNYKTEILGGFINQQLLTEIKQHLLFLLGTPRKAYVLMVLQN